jgi:hypothetical protein
MGADMNRAQLHLGVALMVLVAWLLPDEVVIPPVFVLGAAGLVLLSSILYSLRRLPPLARLEIPKDGASSRLRRVRR